MAKKKKKRGKSHVNVNKEWKKAPLWVKIAFFCELIVCFLSALFFHNNAIALISMAFFLTVLPAVICSMVKHKENTSYLVAVLLLEWLAQCIILIYWFTFYTPVSGTFPLWQFVLIAGLALGVFIAVKWLWKEQRFWGKVGYLLMSCFLSIMLFVITVSHLNFALDFGEPVRYTATITDKEVDINVGKYRRNHYEFELDLNGEKIKMEIPFTDYYKYDIGDLYVFEYYEGAFNEPFYFVKDII